MLLECVLSISYEVADTSFKRGLILGRIVLYQEAAHKSEVSEHGYLAKA